MNKVKINITYPEQFNFAWVEVLFPSGNRNSVNGYKIESIKDRTVQIMCYQNNHKIGIINKRIKLKDNGEATFSLDCKREFQLGIWNETDKRNSQGKEIIKAIE